MAGITLKTQRTPNNASNVARIQFTLAPASPGIPCAPSAPFRPWRTCRYHVKFYRNLIWKIFSYCRYVLKINKVMMLWFFLTTSCLNKHNFEFKHRQLLGAAELFEMEPCLKRNRLFSLETVCAVHILLNMRNLNIFFYCNATLFWRRLTIKNLTV